MDPLGFHINAFREQAIKNNWLPLLREARQLMQPIGAYRDDEYLLVRSLATAHIRRQPEQEALRGLHGVNFHAENVWRDYYFAHRPHIDMRVSDLLQRLQTHMSASPILPPSSEERTNPPSAHPAAATGNAGAASAPAKIMVSSQPAGSGSDSLPTPISPHLSLASPYQQSAPTKRNKLALVSGDDEAYVVRKLQEALDQDESFKVTHVAKSMAAEAPHRAMNTWRQIMYRHPEARAILSKRKNCVLLRADDAAAADDDDDVYISSAEDEDSDDEQSAHLRSSRRSRFPSLRKRETRPSRRVSDSESDESADEDEESDAPRARQPSKQYVNGHDYTESESRGRHRGPYTLGDMKALAFLLLKHPELETLAEHRMGELIEENLGIRTASAWRMTFVRRKHHIAAIAAQMKADQEIAMNIGDQSAPQTSNVSPASASSSSNLPPTKRPRLTVTMT
ncbi:hypothetical protein PENSPDRAFT_738882 [Peniophora sp. CONT]|nr:hypothetical protein PENSPDRAFT_738882 [Peniophora sp. CONT]